MSIINKNIRYWFSRLTCTELVETAARRKGRYLNYDRFNKEDMAEKFKEQDFLEYVVKALVDNPDDVKVDRKVDEMGVLLTLKINPEDMGKIIGRSGNTAKAIRTLLRVVGMANHARVNLKIEEPEGGRVSKPSTQSVDDVVEDLKL